MGSTLRESSVDLMAMPLDPSLLNWSEVEREFLKEVISPDEDVVKERLTRIQKEYVCRGFSPL